MERGPQERRRAPRHEVEGLTGTLRLVSKADILNISVTGMAVRTATHLRVGQTCDVRLEHGPRSLRLPGTVVWAHLVSFGKSAQGQAGPVYEIGFEFRDMLTDHARELLSLLGETAVISLDTRIAGRFQADAGGPAVLEASTELLALKISTSGILVETDVRPEPDQEVALELALGTVRFPCRGRVAYVEPRSPEGSTEAPDGGGTLVGIEFVGLDRAGRGTLEAFIAEHLG